MKFAIKDIEILKKEIEQHKVEIFDVQQYKLDTRLFNDEKKLVDNNQACALMEIDIMKRE